MGTTDARVPPGATSSSFPSDDTTKQKSDLSGNDLFSDNMTNISSRSSGAIPKSSSRPEKPLTTPSNTLDSKTDKSAITEQKESAPIPPKDDRDLFSSSKIVSNKTETKPVKKRMAPSGIDDDIFSSAAKSTFKKPTAADDDDNLFTSSKKTTKITTMSAVPVFEPPPLDDDDDIFSSGTKKKKSAIAQVLDDDDDDDIFAGSSVAKTTARTKAPAAPDDDDIFADASINKPKGNTQVSSYS